MDELSLPSLVSFYVLLTLIGLFALLVWGWQIKVLQGKAMQNPDGTSDDWHEQKTHYGIAFSSLPSQHRRYNTCIHHTTLGALSSRFSQLLVCLGEHNDDIDQSALRETENQP
jgi:hypothetical protein